MHARIGDVVLHPGGVLLLDAGPDFWERRVTAEAVSRSCPSRGLRAPAVTTSSRSWSSPAVAMIVFYTAGVTELIIAAIFAAGIMIACGALSEQEARDAIKWDVIVTIAAAFGMSKALQNSGVAGAVADKLVRLAELSGTGRGGCWWRCTWRLSLSARGHKQRSRRVDVPGRGRGCGAPGEGLASMSFLLMLAASASFMSPFGYQTT